MAADVFSEMLEDEFPNILKVLKEEKDWPNNFVLHELISVLGVYKKANTQFKHKIYLHGDTVSGVYLNKISVNLADGEKNFFFVYTADMDLSALHHALTETQVVPWQTGSFHFLMVHVRFYPVVCEIFVAKGVQFEPLHNHILWLPVSAEPPLTTVPDDMYLGLLKEKHIDEVDLNWPHRFPGSDIVIREHILNNFGIGLFRKSDDRLVSSALCNFTGAIAVLYSDSEFRGRGYAQNVVGEMVKEIRHRGWIPFCTVIVGNSPPEKLFKKCGFEVFTESTWMISKNRVENQSL